MSSTSLLSIINTETIQKKCSIHCEFEKQYKTNNQCWNEVMQGVKDSNRRTKICIELFGQENLIGLSNEQKELFWKSI